jgi:hypothetical protein
MLGILRGRLIVSRGLLALVSHHVYLQHVVAAVEALGDIRRWLRRLSMSKTHVSLRLQ